MATNNNKNNSQQQDIWDYLCKFNMNQQQIKQKINPFLEKIKKYHINSYLQISNHKNNNQYKNNDDVIKSSTIHHEIGQHFQELLMGQNKQMIRDNNQQINKDKIESSLNTAKSNQINRKRRNTLDLIRINNKNQGNQRQKVIEKQRQKQVLGQNVQTKQQAVNSNLNNITKGKVFDRNSIIISSKSNGRHSKNTIFSEEKINNIIFTRNNNNTKDKDNNKDNNNKDNNYKDNNINNVYNNVNNLRTLTANKTNYQNNNKRNAKKNYSTILPRTADPTTHSTNHYSDIESNKNNNHKGYLFSKKKNYKNSFSLLNQQQQLLQNQQQLLLEQQFIKFKMLIRNPPHINRGGTDNKMKKHLIDHINFEEIQNKFYKSPQQITNYKLFYEKTLKKYEQSFEREKKSGEKKDRERERGKLDLENVEIHHVNQPKVKRNKFNKNHRNMFYINDEAEKNNLKKLTEKEGQRKQEREIKNQINLIHGKEIKSEMFIKDTKSKHISQQSRAISPLSKRKISVRTRFCSKKSPSKLNNDFEINSNILNTKPNSSLNFSHNVSNFNFVNNSLNINNFSLQLNNLSSNNLPKFSTIVNNNINLKSSGVVKFKKQQNESNEQIDVNKFVSVVKVG